MLVGKEGRGGVAGLSRSVVVRTPPSPVFILLTFVTDVLLLLLVPYVASFPVMLCRAGVELLPDWLNLLFSFCFLLSLLPLVGLCVCVCYLSSGVADVPLD